MFEREIPRYQLSIESELERALINLKTETVNSEEYLKALSIVERLNGMLDKQKPSSVSKDTMLVVAANLVGIILVISHEQVGNAVTSRALGFIMRPR